MEKKIIDIFLKLFFEGPVTVAEDMIREQLYKVVDEEQINHIILDFSQMLENDKLRKELKKDIEQLCSELRKMVEKADLDVMDQMEETVRVWLQNLDMDEIHQERLCESFLGMMLQYIKEKDLGLYRDLRLNQKMISIEKKIEKLTKSDRVENDSDKLSKKKKLKEYLDNSWQSMVRIDNVERMQDRPEDRKRIEQAYQKGQQVIFLYGDPGMGKTVLAKTYANAGGYSKVFFLSYELSYEHTLKKLLGGEIEGSASDVIDYFQELSSEEKKSVLLIIDNFNDDTYDTDTKKYDEELKGKFYGRLLGTGVRLLITTRIEVNGNQQKVQPLKNIRKLFLSCCGIDDSCNDKRIDTLIKAVRENTLLVTLLAYIWRDSTEKEKSDLLRKLERAEMAEDDHEIAIETGRGYPSGTATFYQQLEEIFYYGPVLKSEGRKKWMASAALLPLEGMEKEDFLSIMQGLDKKELKDLLNRRWILQDGERIFVHAGIREVTRKNPEVTTFENCRQFCYGIGRKMDVDREELLHERIRYRIYGQEIYNVFPVEKDEELLWLYYNLSDVYDHLKEKEVANQLAQAVLDQIELFRSDTMKIARILSGTAYSKIQSAHSEEDLAEPKEMLDQAENILREVPLGEQGARYYKIRGKVYSNQGAYKQKTADLRKASSRNAYKESKEMHEKTLEYRTEMVDKWEKKITPHEYRELLKDKALSYKNVATEQFHLGEYEEAIKNHKEAIKIYHKLGELSSCAFIQKLLIGCVLAWYRKDLELRGELLEEVLNYYPQIVEIFWDNGQKEFMEESLCSFNMIEKIIEIDKRGKKYQARVEEIKRQIERYNLS